uniref:S1 motif domain-containing protein n=1 Tax=Strongyloides papillosus TaxID=174720 RepID=A0A0N5CD84_STREA
MLLRSLVPNLLKYRGNLRGISHSSCVLCSEESKPKEDGIDVFEDLLKSSIELSKKEEKLTSFPKLFRQSKFVELGDFKGRTVVGHVVHKVQDDLYIDIGLKFNAVVKTPSKDREKYVLGAKVLMKLLDPELSERFLGSKKDLTLLEADAILLGLLRRKN